MATKPKPEQTDAQKESALKNALGGKALTILKQRHPEEYETILSELYEQNGLTRKRRLSAEERERKTLADLAEKYGVALIENVEDEPVEA